MMVSTSDFKYQCSIESCREIFEKRLELRNHLLHHHNNFKTIFQCPLCKEEFNSFRKLKFHEKKHGDFVCGICGQQFAEKVYLVTHSNVHLAERAKYKCDLCGKEFFYKGNLKVHKKQKHEKVKFKCFICDNELSTKQKLDNHLKRQHEKNGVVEDIEINLNNLNNQNSLDDDDDDNDDNGGEVEDDEENDNYEMDSIRYEHVDYYMTENTSSSDRQHDNDGVLTKEDLDLLESDF